MSWTRNPCGRSGLPRRVLVAAVLAASAAGCVGQCGSAEAAEAVLAATDADRFFEDRIRPLLAQRCFECHGPETQESALRLDSRSAVLEGGTSGEPAARPGDAERSLVVRAVRHQGDYRMPPDGRLSDADIEALEAWVRMGLPWPREAALAVLTQEEQAERDRREHWSYRPIVPPALPPTSDASWTRTPLDRFVLARLEAAGLQPSPAADRRTLIRRLSFDLLGLPPSVDDVEAFVRDPRPDAYEQLVDRFLASPRYGERWGRHWMDVARYADTRGYAFDRERRYAFAYTYRDYVVRALNSDLPYDQFVLEQLAADQLDPATDRQRLAALGFLTVGRRFNNRHEDIDDQIDVVTRGLLGLTVACARCHAHKYDAIPTEDYYSLYGVFASCYEPDELPLIGEPEPGPEYEAYRSKLEQLRAELDAFARERHVELLDESRRRVAEYLVHAVAPAPDQLEGLSFMSLGKDELKPRLLGRWRDYLAKRVAADHPVWGPLIELAALEPSDFSAEAPEILRRWLDKPSGVGIGQLNPAVKSALAGERIDSLSAAAQNIGQLLVDCYERSKSTSGQPTAAGRSEAEQQLLDLLHGAGSPTAVPLDELSRYLNRAQRNRYRALETRVDEHQANAPGAPPRAMVVYDQEAPVEPRVFVRGDARRPGDPVPRQFLMLLAGQARQPFRRGSGRRELAEAIIAPDNPLTARVIANRVWMHHFGEPLVDTPSDMGIRSDAPAQPELLDYLAARLRDRGWPLKPLHREIVLSGTYRQSSHFRPRAASVDPENRLLWRMNRRRLEFEPLRDAMLDVAGRLDLAMGGRPVDLLDDGTMRRSVYGFVDRQDLPNLFRIFDFPSPDQSQSMRPETTVPQQSLFLMNSPFVMRQVKALAGPVAGNFTSDVHAGVDALHRLLFARPATDADQAAADAFLDGGLPSEQTPANHHPMTRFEQYIQLLLLTNEFAFVD